MKAINYIKKNGFKRIFVVLWQYKLELVLENFINIFTKHKPLKNTIIIESHNDFDCNGGAFYNYLIKNHYNDRYKIVWRVRRKVKEKLPKNVTCIPLLGPSFRKAYHICTAKYSLYDCEGCSKVRDDQIIVYCSHGAGGFKNIEGKLKIPNYVNYILFQSKKYLPIQANQWSVKLPDSRAIFIGYPAHDTFYVNDRSELKKIIDKKYNKVILWMPTFRKGGGFGRNDSTKEQKFGIPLINNLDEYNKLNSELYSLNTYLIIKIHPKQDLKTLGVRDLSNIKILTGQNVKELHIDNYNLIKCSDALISDYSGVAYEYLQLNKPIAYVLDDMNEYISGFVVDDIHTLMAGHEIYNFNDLKKFIDDVTCDNDKYKKRREELRDYIYEYHDGNSCERLAKLLNL